MHERYRLVFSGEIVEGQHVAVVKRRLVESLNLTVGQVEKLFSGRDVTVKGEADPQVALRIQSAFEQSGARLRLVPIAGDKSQGVQSTAPAGAAALNGGEPLRGPELLPVGSDVLRADERARVKPVNVDVSHITLQEKGLQPDDRSPAVQTIQAPDYSVAQVGVDLIDHVEVPPADMDPQFDLAEVGALIPNLPVDRTPPVDVDSVNFDVAAVGADMGTPRKAAETAAPDVSHLRVSND